MRHSTFLAPALLLVAFSAGAQVPVDDDGNEIGSVYSTDADDGADFSTRGPDELLSVTELEDLVAPVALYPDDLLAIVLPASTFPLQVVEAARFLERVEDDESLQPDDDWDDSVVALLNYPEVVELMNEDLDWTWSLGEAVVAQQADVLTAVNSFRDRARNAGNLTTDQYQRVAENDEGIIEIDPVDDNVIYVPYYEPERVVVYQTQPVYHYYERPYPVYYYPYPSYYVHYRPFWGVTTNFSIGWVSHSLHVWHHSHYGHPFYGHRYYNRYWYRSPSIYVFNNRYYGGGRHVRRHYRYGDYWQPRYDRRLSRSNQRITRSYSDSGTRLRSNRRNYGDSGATRRYSSSVDRTSRPGFSASRERQSQQRPSTVNRESRRYSERRDSSQQRPSTREVPRNRELRREADRGREVRREPERTRQVYREAPRREPSVRQVPRNRTVSPERSVRREAPARQPSANRPPSRQSSQPRSAPRESRAPQRNSQRPSQSTRQQAPRRSSPNRESARSERRR